MCQCGSGISVSRQDGVAHEILIVVDDVDLCYGIDRRRYLGK